MSGSGTLSSNGGEKRNKAEDELSVSILTNAAQNLTLGLSDVVQHVLTSSQRTVGNDPLGSGSPFFALLELLEG